MEATLELDDKGPPSRSTPAPDVLSTLLELHSHQLLRANMRKMAQEKARRINTFEMDDMNIGAAEDAHSHAFQIRYADANGGLKNISFFCGDGFDRNGPTWYNTRHFRMESRKFDRFPYVHGRFHISRANIVSFSTFSHKINLC